MTARRRQIEEQKRGSTAVCYLISERVGWGTRPPRKHYQEYVTAIYMSSIIAYCRLAHLWPSPVIPGYRQYDYCPQSPEGGLDTSATDSLLSQILNGRSRSGYFYLAVGLMYS